MTKPQEILTPSLPEFCEKIIKLVQQGYRMHRDPEMLSWQYYCEMVQEVAPEVVVATSPVTLHKPTRGPKPKIKKEVEPAKAPVEE